MGVAGLEYRFPLSNDLDSAFCNSPLTSCMPRSSPTWGMRGRPSGRSRRNGKPMQVRAPAGILLFLFLSDADLLQRRVRVRQVRSFRPEFETSVTYGKEWRFYFGVLFGFDLD